MLEEQVQTLTKAKPIHLSEAAACDGLLYQITPEDDSNAPGPGVLPI